MARTFDIEIVASPALLLQRARRAASENGVTLSGDESSGRFSHKKLRGEYLRLGRTVKVTITHKHRLVPWSVLEGRMRGIFGGGPTGMGRVSEKATAPPKTRRSRARRRASRRHPHPHGHPSRR